MTDSEARDEIKAAIEYYESRGLCWISVVTYLAIRATFGGWLELLDSIRPTTAGRPRKGEQDATRI